MQFVVVYMNCFMFHEKSQNKMSEFGFTVPCEFKCIRHHTTHSGGDVCKYIYSTQSRGSSISILRDYFHSTISQRDYILSFLKLYVKLSQTHIPV